MKKFGEISKKMQKKLLLYAYLSLAGAIVCAVLFGISMDRPLLSVIFFLLMVGLAILFYKLHKKAMPPEFYEWLAEKAYRGLAAFFNFIFKPLKLLFKKLGLFQGKGFLHGKDERSFFFMRPGQKNRRKNERMPKWKNLTNNAQRVRFLFMKYMTYRIKKGYVFRKTMTPAEMRQDLLPGVDPEDENAAKGFDLLFDNYPIARYEGEERAEELLPDPLIAEMRGLL